MPYGCSRTVRATCCSAASAAALALVSLLAPAARGEIFELTNQGRIKGKLLNPDESPRVSYEIETTSGGRVTLPREAVAEVVRQSEAQVRYEQIRPRYPDTVEGQWALAEWCRENNQPTARKTHLQRVVELNPEHAEARRALGYFRSDGRWVTQEQLMTSRGYVRYKGRWLLPQAVELIEERRKVELAEAEWRGKLKRWRDWLETDRFDEAKAEMLQIQDVHALPALTLALREDANESRRMLYTECVRGIQDPKALALLVQLSLEDPSEEVRLSALDVLAADKHPDVIAQYVAGLRSKENVVVNRAAIGLAAMQSPTTLGPLIDALVTTHKHKIVSGGSPDQVNASFNTNPGASGLGAAPGGLSVGQSTRIITERRENHDVLDTLIRLSGVNFEFDVPAWKRWLAARQKPADLDARRD